MVSLPLLLLLLLVSRFADSAHVLILSDIAVARGRGACSVLPLLVSFVSLTRGFGLLLAGGRFDSKTGTALCTDAT